jgi:hypothetical protein
MRPVSALWQIPEAAPLVFCKNSTNLLQKTSSDVGKTPENQEYFRVQGMVRNGVFYWHSARHIHTLCG